MYILIECFYLSEKYESDFEDEDEANKKENGMLNFLYYLL